MMNKDEILDLFTEAQDEFNNFSRGVIKTSEKGPKEMRSIISFKTDGYTTYK